LTTHGLLHQATPTNCAHSHTVPTTAFLNMSPDMDMLFAHFGCTHLPLYHPFCPWRTCLQGHCGSYIASSKSNEGFPVIRG